MAYIQIMMGPYEMTRPLYCESLLTSMGGGWPIFSVNGLRCTI